MSLFLLLKSQIALDLFFLVVLVLVLVFIFVVLDGIIPIGVEDGAVAAEGNSHLIDHEDDGSFDARMWARAVPQLQGLLLTKHLRNTAHTCNHFLFDHSVGVEGHTSALKPVHPGPLQVFGLGDHNPSFNPEVLKSRLRFQLQDNREKNVQSESAVASGEAKARNHNAYLQLVGNVEAPSPQALQAAHRLGWVAWNVVPVPGCRVKRSKQGT